MTAILRKEFRSYFTGMTGWVFMAFMLVIIGIYAAVYHFGYGYGNFELVVGSVGFIFLILVPILTMNSIAGERRTRTDQLLLTSPVRVGRIVFGKYIAMLGVLLAPVLVACLYPLILAQYGNVNLATAYASLFGFLCLGAALISIGMFISSLTESQIIAAVATLAVLLVCFFMPNLVSLVSGSSLGSTVGFIVVGAILAAIVYLMTKSGMLAAAVGLILAAGLIAAYLLAPTAMEGTFTMVLGWFSLFDGLESFVSGVFDWTAVVYYASIAALFLFFTAQSIQKRRWS